ncbi:hypothetical protein [Tengunoibacter tsumagoiensis]|uniref:Uncharacterized protein n=1 Tax=Tengunoibacter tsumagoiensis TaxID=2014871 RepID=A0A402A5V2_9CHLR|nr:hypothetical protein [Tengunoibacter tsumagoiensis]GCE14490.1 hypothetical protein KTT_43490 [Tengunoibacter tsumagoiensis]
MTSSLSYLVGQTLTWTPTAILKTRYDLIGPEAVPLASLDMSNWSSKANATVPEGTLFIKKEGWSGKKIAIYAMERGPLIATYQRTWTGTSGNLVFSNGRTFRWRKSNFWGTQKAWTDAAGNTSYVQFSAHSFSRKIEVIFDSQAGQIQELSLLLVLGLYNIVVERRDAAAASASASV